jgi:putative hydrolase of the HAD superfamily
VLVEKWYGTRRAVIDEPEAVAGAERVIPELARRYRLAIVANTSVATDEDIRQALATVGLDRYFRAVVTSVDAGARKPEPEIYLRALDRLGLRPSDVAMVGNQLDTDIAGALALGMPAILLRWNAEYAGEIDGIVPTAVVTALEELPPLLDTL